MPAAPAERTHQAQAAQSHPSAPVSAGTPPLVAGGDSPLHGLEDAAWPLTAGALRIRPARLEDTEVLHEYWRLPVTQEYTDRSMATWAETRADLASRLAREDVLLCVIEREGKGVGDIGGRIRRPHALGREAPVWDMELGYAVHPDHHGEGIAATAVGEFTRFLHEDLGIRRIIAMVFAENTASLRVLRKNGYRLEGTQREAVLGRRGRWLDDCTLVHRYADGSSVDPNLTALLEAGADPDSVEQPAGGLSPERQLSAGTSWTTRS
ncbi:MULTISPECIES: GNAT family N-acetyltransferase [unclassified Brachybacterium]|uniref:GNAT family N-acetyltransferase n=1 Tax=unclassified Brachybacterium TaxID=2623841 RepID=UPI003618E0DE